MAFLALRTAPGPTVILCFDTPDRFRLRLFEALNSNFPRFEEPDIYQLHTYLLGQILDLYDESVWALRDTVRDIERVSGVEAEQVSRVIETIQDRSTSQRIDPGFPVLHDIARHAIHVSETLDVAIENMSSMIRQYRSVFEDKSYPLAHEKRAFARTLQCFNFQLQTFKSLKARSDSNQARMQNEITLVGAPPHNTPAA